MLEMSANYTETRMHIPGSKTEACNGLRHAKGDTGKPELPRVVIGEPQRGEGAIRNMPPKAFRYESYAVNTGDSWKDDKGGGK